MRRSITSRCIRPVGVTPRYTRGVVTATNRAPGDARAALIPAEILPLFDDAFVRSCGLIEEYVPRLALGAFRSTGLADACAEPATRRTRRSAAPASPRTWRACPRRGSSQRSPRAAGSSERRGPATARASTWRGRCRRSTRQEILAAQAANDERCLPSFRIAAMAAERYPAVLRGELTGEQALFDAEGIVAWSKYFSNANPLYGIANAIGAVAAARALADRSGAVLELGGGLGSGAEALLERLDAATAPSYRFTEISPLFLRRAERSLARVSRPRPRVRDARHRPAVRRRARNVRPRLRGQRAARRARSRRDARRGPRRARARAGRW